MTTPTVYDHYEASDTDLLDGTYRVVGSDEAAVTFLRVADTSGTRLHTGEIYRISYDELEKFEPAENPDGNQPLRNVVTSKFEMVYWSLRVFSRQLTAHPLPTTTAVTLILAGSVGDRILPFPETVLGSLILTGSLALAYIGSGRL
jgi:hypothetical protein